MNTQWHGSVIFLLYQATLPWLHQTSDGTTRRPPARNNSDIKIASSCSSFGTCSNTSRSIIHVSFLLFPQRDNCVVIILLHPFDVSRIFCSCNQVFGQTFQFVNPLNECVITLPDECGHSLLYTNQHSPNKVMKLTPRTDFSWLITAPLRVEHTLYLSQFKFDFR